MPLEVTVEDGIATLVLNRPEAMNTVDPEMRAQLRAAWRMIEENEEVQVAILTGAGDRAFCAGSDLKKTPPPQQAFAREFFLTGDDSPVVELEQVTKPLIAAVNGYALGGGLEMALACDLRIAADCARFGLAEVRVGSMPGAMGTLRLPRMINHATAMKMLLTGDWIDAQEAFRAGLVSDVVPLAELMALARKLAARICENAPLSVRAIKMMATRGLDIPMERGRLMERMAFGLLRNTEDRLEGRVAFQEKRKPVYKGR